MKRRLLLAAFTIAAFVVGGVAPLRADIPVASTTGTLLTANNCVTLPNLVGQSSATFQEVNTPGPTVVQGSVDGSHWSALTVYDLGGSSHPQPFTPSAGTSYTISVSSLSYVRICADATWATQSANVTIRSSASSLSSTSNVTVTGQSNVNVHDANGQNINSTSGALNVAIAAATPIPVTTPPPTTSVSITVGATPLPVTTPPPTTSVSVSNFPSTQPVSGTVSVGNFPATQPVSGSVQFLNGSAINALEAVNTIAIASGTAQNVVVKSTTGRVFGALVTTSGTGELDCYDNTSSAAGTKVLVVPASAAVGTFYVVNFPLSFGLVCAETATSSAITVSYS